MAHLTLNFQWIQINFLISPVKGLFKFSLSLKPLESETNSFCSCSISGHTRVGIRNAVEGNRLCLQASAKMNSFSFLPNQCNRTTVGTQAEKKKHGLLKSFFLGGGGSYLRCKCFKLTFSKEMSIKKLNLHIKV